VQISHVFCVYPFTGQNTVCASAFTAVCKSAHVGRQPSIDRQVPVQWRQAQVTKGVLSWEHHDVGGWGVNIRANIFIIKKRQKNVKAIM